MGYQALEQFIDRVHSAFHEGDDQVHTKLVEAENMGLIRQMYEAISRNDLDSAIEMLHDEIELDISGPPTIPFVGRWQGRQAVGDAMRRNFAMVEGGLPEVQTVVAQGDTVVVISHERGRFLTTGSTYETHWVHICTIRDGKIVRFREIIDGRMIEDPVAI